MPFNPTSNSGLANFTSYMPKPDQQPWQPTDQYDAARHFGVMGNAQLMPEAGKALDDIPQAMDQRRQARATVNMLGSAAGRQKKVAGFEDSEFRRYHAIGQRMRENILAGGGGDIGASAQLLGGNAAIESTGNYAAYLESPQGQEEIARLLMQINSPDEVFGLGSLMGGFESQAAPRDQFHEQMAAQDAADDGLGGYLSAAGEILGQTGGWGSLFGAAGAVGGGGSTRKPKRRPGGY